MLNVADGCIELIVDQDITAFPADFIVNAANSSLMGGGGVDGAIHRAGGPAIHAACLAIEEVNGVRCPTGQARATPGGRLPCQVLIHAVGPRYRDYGEAEAREKLREVYEAVLTLATELMEGEEASIAFPTISTGIYGFPKKAAAEIAVEVMKVYLLAHEGKQGCKRLQVVFLGNMEDVEAYKQVFLRAGG